jgi:hypothetical protein
VLIVQQSALPVIEQGFKGGKPQTEVEHIALNM